MNIDTLKMIGKKIPAGTPEIRDAVHIAVITVGVIERVYPGQHVGLTGGLADPKQGKKIGIIDPFLESPIFPGDKVFLHLYPGSITSLLHQWSHPDFPDSKLNQALMDSQERAIDENEILKEKVAELEKQLKESESKRRLDKDEALAFLEQLAKEHDIQLESMIEEIAEKGSYTQIGSTSLENINDDELMTEKVYRAIEAVTGKSIRRSGWGLFSCSC